MVSDIRKTQIVFENRVLRKISVLTRDKITGDWRKMHDEELHNYFFALIIIFGEEYKL
jgi:hypothetical protein